MGRNLCGFAEVSGGAGEMTLPFAEVTFPRGTLIGSLDEAIGWSAEMIVPSGARQLVVMESRPFRTLSRSVRAMNAPVERAR
jgi:hypothetical protein